MRSLRDNLGDAVNEARTGKATLLPSGDELTVKMGKLVDVARAAVDEDTASLVADLESRLLLVQIANWRFLALRDSKGPANFRTNVDRASQRLAALEKSPQATELRATLAPVKTSLGIYKSAFETTSAAMLQADEIYHKSLAPLIVDSIAKLKVAETALKKDYKDSRSQAEAMIDGTTVDAGDRGRPGHPVRIDRRLPDRPQHRWSPDLDDAGDGAARRRRSRGRDPRRAARPTRSATWPRRSRCSRTT